MRTFVVGLLLWSALWGHLHAAEYCLTLDDTTEALVSARVTELGLKDRKTYLDARFLEYLASVKGELLRAVELRLTTAAGVCLEQGKTYYVTMDAQTGAITGVCQ